jgi:predicted transcriptional regulator
VAESLGLELGEIIVTGEEALQVADALTSTSLRILQLISDERLDISTIAKKLDLSEPYISDQMRMLEDNKLIKVRYERGKRGIRKLCELAIGRVIIVIKPSARLKESRLQEHAQKEVNAIPAKKGKTKKTASKKPK